MVIYAHLGNHIRRGKAPRRTVVLYELQPLAAARIGDHQGHTARRRSRECLDLVTVGCGVDHNHGLHRISVVQGRHNGIRIVDTVVAVGVVRRTGTRTGKRRRVTQVEVVVVYRAGVTGNILDRISAGNIRSRTVSTEYDVEYIGSGALRGCTLYDRNGSHHLGIHGSRKVNRTLTTAGAIRADGQFDGGLVDLRCRNPRVHSLDTPLGNVRRNHRERHLAAIGRHIYLRALGIELQILLRELHYGLQLGIHIRCKGYLGRALLDVENRSRQRQFRRALLLLRKPRLAGVVHRVAPAGIGLDRDDNVTAVLVYHRAAGRSRKDIHLVLHDRKQRLLLDLITYESERRRTRLRTLVEFHIHRHRYGLVRSRTLARCNGQPRRIIGNTDEPVAVCRNLDLLTAYLVRELQRTGTVLVGPLDGHRRLHIVAVVVSARVNRLS